MKIADPQAVIDLTKVPYFVAPPSLEEPSSQERLTGGNADDNVLVIPDYTVDRNPAASATLHLGGSLGTAAVLDVAAHPIRARARRINFVTITAIPLVAGVAMVMATLIVTFRR